MSDQIPPSRRRSAGGAAAANGSRRTGMSALNHREQAMLACEAGPSSGQQFALRGAELVLGRANDVEISIPDTSVSRRHVRFRLTEEGWVASDLGSGNGTLVNGESLVDEQLLRDGDSIVVGDTELTFSHPVPQGDAQESRIRRMSAELPVRVNPDLPVRVNPDIPVRTTRSAVRRRSEAASQKSAARGKIVLLRGLIVVLALLIIGVAYRNVTQQKAAKERQQAAVVEAARQRVSAGVEDAKAMILAGKYKAAKARLDQLAPELDAAPEDLRGYVRMYLESCEKEIPNETLLDRVREALSKDRPGAAKLALAKVPSATLQVNLVSELDRQIQKKLPARLDAAREAMEKSEFEEVVAITEDFLLGVPGDRDATKLRDDARAELKQPAKAAAPVAKSVGSPKRWDAAVDLYGDGDLAGAIAVASDCAEARVTRCRILLKNLNEFGELNRRPDSLDEKRLQRLAQLDREINGGRPSRNAIAATTRLANLHYKRASAAKAAGEWAKAAESAKKALQADPDHAPARALLSELRDEAKKVFMNGYMLKDVDQDEALEKFRAVVDMTPPGDELHTKAKGYIEKLER